jgi:hypothetical protein
MFAALVSTDGLDGAFSLSNRTNRWCKVQVNKDIISSPDNIAIVILIVAMRCEECLVSRLINSSKQIRCPYVLVLKKF